MKKTYNLLKFKARFFAYTVLIGVLLYAVAGRVLLSFLPDYRIQLEAYLSEQLDVPVEVGQLSAGWDGFDPILQIRNISINSAYNAHVQSADIKFAFLNSVLARAPRIKSITLDSVNLGLRQDSEGVWWLAGFDLSQIEAPETSDQTYRLGDILDGANLLLLDAFVRVESQLEDERVWRLPSASLSYLDSKIYARGNVIEPDGLQPLLRFVYNSETLDSTQPTSGQLFIEARSAGVFDNILKSYSWLGVSLQSLDANGRVWLDLNGGDVEAVFADLQMHRLDWNLDEKSLPPLVKSSMRVAWRGNKHGERIDLYDLDLHWKDNHCALSSGLFESVDDHYKVGFSSVDLECVNDYLLSLGLAEGRLAERLRVSQPSGFLENLNIDFRLTDQGVEDFKLVGELKDVDIEAFDGAPAISGLQGYIESGASNGFVLFDSEQMGLAFPDLYLEGWQANHAFGEIHWTVGEDVVEIVSHDLNLELASGGMVYGDFVVRLNGDEHEDYLGLVLGVRDIDFENVVHLVPYYQVPQDLYQWLDSALVGGTVENGVFVGYGSIENDSAENSFSSSLQVSTKEGVLKFEEEWPELSGLNIDIVLHDDRLEISGENAVIADTPVQKLAALLPGSTGNGQESELVIDLSFNADTPQYDYWLGKSPLRDELSALHESVRFEGKTEGKLKLTLDLENDLQTDYSIQLQATDLTAKVLAGGVEFTEIGGLIDISSDKGVNADDLKLQAFGHPAKAQITQISEDNPMSSLVAESLQISMSGTASVDAIGALYESSWGYGLAGEADFQAELNLPQDDSLPAELTMRSLLTGIESTWPEPFSKEPGETVSLKTKVEFKRKQTNVDIELAGSTYPSAKGTLLFIDDDMTFARLNVDARAVRSDTSKSRPNIELLTDGLNVQVDMDELDVEPWVDFVREEIPAEDSGSNNVLGQIAVRAGLVRSTGLAASDVVGLISPEEGLIELSGENVVGKVTLPTEENALALEFDRLNVFTEPDSGLDADSKENVPGSTGNEYEQREASIDPRDIISMEFDSRDTVIDGKGWGSWSFFTDSDDVGLLVRNIRGQVHGATFQGRLNWQLYEGSHHTILTMSGNGKNIAPVLELFGQSSPLSSEQFKTDLALVWPDQPQNFSLARLSGSADFKFNEGLIETDNNATGVLRMFGIFNADAIGRRLRLDFSDLYKNGISYDSAGFNAVMDQGSMKLVSPLTIKGPSSNYEISGNVDLAQQELDLKMLLQLPLSSNVPLAGLVLGAPVVGGAVWLVDKILGEPLSRLSTVRYSISGNWNDPQMQLEKSINAR